MGRKPQSSNWIGSLKDLQVLINRKQILVDEEIKSSIPSLADEKITWVSPKSNDDFAEYSDEEFLIKLNLNVQDICLYQFWPKGGAVWDALATTATNKVILVEAKANIPEIVTSPTRASEESKKLIVKSLNETKRFLNIKNKVDWSGMFYQYANRLAHLYFLREKCGIDAYLVNIYFINDNTVKGPKTVEEWQGAINVINVYLGTNKRHKLKSYTADIFIDVSEFIKY